MMKRMAVTLLIGIHAHEYYKENVPEFDMCTEFESGNGDAVSKAEKTGYKKGTCKDAGYKYVQGAWSADYAGEFFIEDVYGKKERANVTMMHYYGAECGDIAVSGPEALAIRQEHPEFMFGLYYYLGDAPCMDNYFDIFERSANETLLNKTYEVKYHVKKGGPQRAVAPVDYHKVGFPQHDRCSQKNNVTGDMLQKLKHQNYTEGRCVSTDFKFLDGNFGPVGNTVDVYAAKPRDALHMISYEGEECVEIQVASTASALAVRTASKFDLGSYYRIAGGMCAEYGYDKLVNESREDVWTYMFPTQRFVKFSAFIV